MRRRFPTAILLIAGLLSAATSAADEPARPPITSVMLSGGFSYRNTTLSIGSPLPGMTQTRTTQLEGTSPWLVRLRADWFPLRWLGVEAEGSGDFFRAIQTAQVAGEQEVPVGSASQRAGARLGVALRFVTDGGFTLNGSLGYGIAWSPVIVLSAANPRPSAFSLPSNGPVARIGLGYLGARFEGVASATLMLALDSRVSSLEPQVWLGGRIADLGPTALWVGLDAGLLLESSPLGYGGPTLRFALALKLSLLPPAPPPKRLVDGPPSATGLAIQVLLPDGNPALGALVSLDDANPVAVDAQGQLVVTPKPGRRAATAKLSGYRPASGTAEVVEGQQAALVLRLEALTGPGQLSGIVRASATGKPVPDATVTAGEGPPVQTGADGTYRFEKLGPGPVQVRVDAQGFTAAEEIAQVPPESAATLDVQLEALGKGSPATVRGLVRSRTGEALKASIVIKGVATKVQVTPEGRFFVTVPGGTYLFIISAPGYATQTKKVVLADGDQAIVHTELQKVSK